MEDETVYDCPVMQKHSLIAGFLAAALAVWTFFPAGEGLAQDMKALPAPKVEKAPISGLPGPGDGEGLVFLELYTAENCAFCPAAERNFSDILTGRNVIGLTCMVDYFDSGKPGQLSRPFCRAQQSVYAKLLKAGSLYTPQLVINGADHVAGHRLNDVSEGIRQARLLPAMPQELQVKKAVSEGSYDVVLPAIAPPDMTKGEKFLLRIVTVKRAPDLALIAGAQQKREGTPQNAATALVEGGFWDGRRTVWTVKPPLDGFSDAFIVLVQDRDSGHILAAGQHALVTE